MKGGRKEKSVDRLNTNYNARAIRTSMCRWREGGRGEGREGEFKRGKEGEQREGEEERME